MLWWCAARSHIGKEAAGARGLIEDSRFHSRGQRCWAAGQGPTDGHRASIETY